MAKIAYRRITVGGVEIFYREADRPGGPGDLRRSSKADRAPQRPERSTTLSAYAYSL
jgi:hypothetical protein